ncbi:transcription factor WRKY19-like [Phragmites australis]|uniref:transcription factor WRKY19-like n=1 Tax=Phragmites australis TaxID=29695 RepID=UPI002D76EAF1|nr:transcription factor WRKY19-like [Phragmites australis]
MESVDGNGGRRLVVTELSHIKELVKQLEVHLGCSPDLCKHLASQISSLTERSIVMITSSNLDGGRKRSAADAGLASPISATPTPSPLSDVTDGPFKNTKKRKMMEKWKHQVRVSTEGGGESPVDDGHSWRKYGQKEILGAKHPRGYYRCTHRHSQGCAATKQVQRTDEDPKLFDVIYHGTHTCVDKALAAAPAGQAAAATQPPEHNPDAHSRLQSLSSTLTVKTERLAATERQGWSATTPFCFSSTPVSGCLAPERSPFSASETLENCGVSPETSDSNHVPSFPAFEAAANVEWRAQSEEIQELVSALVEASTSAPEPAVDMDFADEFFNLDPSFDNLDQSILSYFADPYTPDEQKGIEFVMNTHF